MLLGGDKDEMQKNADFVQAGMVLGVAISEQALTALKTGKLPEGMTVKSLKAHFESAALDKDQIKIMSSLDESAPRLTALFREMEKDLQATLDALTAPAAARRKKNNPPKLG